MQGWSLSRWGEFVLDGVRWGSVSKQKDNDIRTGGRHVGSETKPQPDTGADKATSKTKPKGKAKSKAKSKSKKDSQLILRLDKKERDAFVDLCKELDTSAAREIRGFIRKFMKKNTR